MPAKSCIAQTPLIIIVLAFVSAFLFLHANDHVKYIQSIEHNFEVLILEKLDEEVKKILTFGHHVIRIRGNFLSNIFKHFINCLCSDSPVILGVHHSRYLICSDKVTAFLGDFLALITICWKANVTHTCEHLILGLLRRLDWSFECAKIMIIMSAYLFLNSKSKVTCDVVVL